MTQTGVQAVQSLNLVSIRGDLAKKGWKPKRIERAIEDYRKFLISHQEKPEEEVRPTADVDVVWHCHILRTEKYANDCQVIFGHFFHHKPDEPMPYWYPHPVTPTFWQRLFGLRPAMATCGGGGGAGGGGQGS